MRAEERLWRTEDRRLVGDGHPDGRILAYAPGDQLTDADAELIQKATAEAKAKPAASNKARRKPADK